MAVPGGTSLLNYGLRRTGDTGIRDGKLSRGDPIFVYACEILRFETPPLSKACKRRKFYLFVRQIWEKLTRKCPEMSGLCSTVVPTLL